MQICTRTKALQQYLHVCMCGHTNSQWYTMSYTLISTTSFLFYILITWHSISSKFSLSAENLIIYRPISSIPDFTSIQCNIKAIEQWSSCCSNFLTVNSERYKLRDQGTECIKLPITHHVSMVKLSVKFHIKFIYLRVLLSND